MIFNSIFLFITNLPKKIIEKWNEKIFSKKIFIANIHSKFEK
jgi:hypothetical protein